MINHCFEKFNRRVCVFNLFFFVVESGNNLFKKISEKVILPFSKGQRIHKNQEAVSV